MKKTKVAQTVVGVAAAMALTVAVGKIIPVNLHSNLEGISATNPAGFSATTVANDECCGPYAQHCEGFKGT